MIRRVAVVALLLASPALAAVNVTGTSGTVSHGNPVTVTGTGFGSKSTAAPVMWETFQENHSCMTLTGGASVRGDIDPNDQDPGVSSYCNDTGQQRHTAGGTNYAMRSTLNTKCDGGYLGYDGGSGTSWYSSWWLYLPSDLSWPAWGATGGNNKWWRIFPTGSRNCPDQGIVSHGTGALSFHEHGCSGSCTMCSGSTDDDMAWSPTSFSLGAWHLFEQEYRESSAVDAHDGVLRVWADGVIVHNSTTEDTRPSDSNNPPGTRRPYTMGIETTQGCIPGSGQSAWIDDAYADPTWARVYLCPGGTWATRGKCEIQPPTAWSATSITVTLNQGALANASKAYVYVEDSAGAYNSTGYEVTIGGTAEPPASTTSTSMRGASLRGAEIR